MKTAVVLLADGFEECEALAPIDYMRRAGIDVTVAAVGTEGDLNVTGAHHVVMKADKTWDEVHNQKFDAIVAPGGMPGATNLGMDLDVIDAIQRQDLAGRVVAAICASPGFLLAQACRVVRGKKACGYPGTEKPIADHGGQIVEDPVVIDGHLITAQGPGYAYEFALAIISKLVSSEKAEELREQTMMK